MPLLTEHASPVSEDPRPRQGCDPESPREHAADGLRGLLTARATSAVWTALALFLIASACSATVWLGVPRAAIYGHDTFIVLDGGWRILNGQRPHADFFSPFGPLLYLIAAAGLKLAQLRVEGLAYATAAVGAILGLWAWALARGRFKAWSALLALAFLVSFWLAPFPFGEPFYMTGYAMQYNRLGYALASLALLELYVPRADSRRKGFLDWGGFSTGIAAGLLCFLKISFFPVVCALIASAYILGGKRRKHFLSVLAAFALVAIPMMSYLRWDAAGPLRDLAIIAAARQVRFARGYDPVRTIFRNLGTVLALLGLSYLGWLYSKETKAGRNRLGLRGAFGLAAVAVAADLVLAMSNTQRQGFPLSLLATLILAHRTCETFLSKSDKRRQTTAVPATFALIAAVLLMPVLTDTVNGWGLVLRSNKLGGTDPSVARFDAPHLAGLVLGDHDEPGIDAAAHNGALYVKLVNEGLGLLRRASSPREHVACLCFANPFSYALLRPPAQGGSVVFAYGVSITALHSPSAARILGNAEVVMYPKTNEDDDPEAATLLAIVGPNLMRSYSLSAESEHWALWRRR